MTVKTKYGIFSVQIDNVLYINSSTSNSILVVFKGNESYIKLEFKDEEQKNTAEKIISAYYS